MARISREQMFMDMAETAAKRGTCLRANVGAMLVYMNRFAIVGYNGAPSGEPHCSMPDLCSRESACTRALHAEANAINAAILEFGREVVKKSALYTTVSPCPDCASLVSRYEIGHVYYRYKYRDSSGISLLIREGVTVLQVLPVGGILLEPDGILVEGSL